MTIANINQEIRDLCSGDSNTTLLDNTTLLRRVNAAYEEVISLIQNCDGLWQFDDTNYTNFPIGTTTLVAGQSDYTFASDVLEVEQVSVLNSNGDWHLLSPIDRSEMGVDPVEYAPDNGLPNQYDKLGNSLLLYPAPVAGQVTLASGLKVTFKRKASVYTSAEVTTGTKEPGFASPYHMIIPYKASIPFLINYRPNRVPAILREIERLEKGLKQFYGRREQDRRKILMPDSGTSFV